MPLVNQQLTIPAMSAVDTSFCVDLQVRGDLIREPNEMFSINARVENTLDAIAAGQASLVITILDDLDGI